MMKVVRLVLGKLILLLDRLTTPQPRIHSPEIQSKLDAATRELALYQFEACPFCVKVRREIRRLGLEISLRDAQNDPEARESLAREGGQIQVPCLRIPAENRWLYESDEIISWLRQRYSQLSGAVSP